MFLSKYKALKIFAFFLLAGLSSPLFASVIPFQATSRIRVRLAEGAAVARIRGYDLRFYQEVPGRGPALIEADRQSEWELRCESGRVRAKRIGNRAGHVGVQVVDLQEPVTIRSPAGFISYAGKPYREELQIHSDGSLCEVVNEVDLEKYLEGLVNAEFSSRWNEESVGAQVVAARTYALYQIRQAALADNHYDVDATTNDQVYDGSIREDANAARVVARTRGLVLTTGSGASVVPLKAFYHSTCGGTTELPEKVWGKATAGFSRRVQCPFCQNSPAAHWGLDMTSRAISEILQRHFRFSIPPSNWPSNWRRVLQGRLNAIQVDRFDESGRVAEVRLSFSGQSLVLSGAQFRDILGASRFKSAAFVVQTDLSGPSRGEVAFHFAGRGNGHGVGMCQWGAKVMGERGYKTASILKFYYPDATLRKLW